MHSISMAKVSFATENYSDALDAFIALNQRYPRESFTSEVQGLIGETYLKTRNYAKAIAYFESVPRTTSRARKAYQIVCYFYGIELFERTDYRQAASYFQKAQTNAFDADLTLSAQYWLGKLSLGRRAIVRRPIRSRHISIPEE